MLTNVIVEKNGEFWVESEDGKNLGGPYKTKDKAKARLAQVEMFKHMKQNTFQSITFNAVGPVRHDRMSDKDYLVVHMIMLTEGVHNGSNGALYYPKEEIVKTPQVWNHKPVIVYHPEQGASTACDPIILSNRQIGIIMNSEVKEGLAPDGKTKVAQLHAEAWLEEDRVSKVDKRVLEAINNKKTLELSTGLFTDNESAQENAEWGGEKYIAVARNFRPDHLAVLPDKVGACSVADGAGFLRLNEAGKPTSFSEDFFPFLKAAGVNTDKLVMAEVSHSHIRQALFEYVRDKISKTDAYVEEVFDNFFIYNLNGSLYRLSYSMNKDDVVKVEGLPEQVTRVIQYRNLKGKVIVENKRKDNTMEKKPLVDKIIASNKTSYKEVDRETLMAENEAVLTNLAALAGEAKPAENETEAEKKARLLKEEEDAAAAAEAKKVKKNEQQLAKPPEKVTVESYIANAPPEVAEVLNDGMAISRANKAAAIKMITANAKNTFSKEDLERKSLKELGNIVRLMAPLEGKQLPVDNDFSALAEVANQTAEEPLTLPTMNFDKSDGNKK